LPAQVPNATKQHISPSKNSFSECRIRVTPISVLLQHHWNHHQPFKQRTVQYMLLVYDYVAGLSNDALKQMYADHGTFTQELIAAGVMETS
jgi:hypothetical protein